MFRTILAGTGARGVATLARPEKHSAASGPMIGGLRAAYRTILRPLAAVVLRAMRKRRFRYSPAHGPRRPAAVLAVRVGRV